MSDALSAEQVAEPLSAEGRVDTSKVSVPSIIDTYARRLMDAYPDNVVDIAHERDILLRWWVAALPAKPDVGERLRQAVLDGLLRASACRACGHLVTQPWADGEHAIDCWAAPILRAALTEQEAGRE